jgi:hypothetical protein
MSDDSFEYQVERAISLYEQANRHSATRTREMIAIHGEIEALSRLMVSADLQQGFKVLRDTKQLDKTFEAVVVRFKHLFKRGAIEAAQWRLANPYKLL